MPKAAIDKNNKTIATEGEIRATAQRFVSTPPPDTCRSQERNQFKFSFLIAAGSDRSHNKRSLFLCENVSHQITESSVRAHSRILAIIMQETC